MNDFLKASGDRKVRIVLPGPGDLAICDICIELYNDTAARELAVGS